jgi:hypothetical protein
MAVATNFNSVRLVKGGVISGDNKATGSITTSDAYYSFGGAADKWGLSLTESDVEASNFGVVVSFNGTGNSPNYTTNYLEATNFGISVPSGATIDGVIVEVEAKFVTVGGQLYKAYVDHIQMKVYYTEAAAGLSKTGGVDGSTISAIGGVDAGTVTKVAGYDQGGG